jgi:hypothetical protein
MLEVVTSSSRTCGGGIMRRGEVPAELFGPATEIKAEWAFSANAKANNGKTRKAENFFIFDPPSFSVR